MCVFHTAIKKINCRIFDNCVRLIHILRRLPLPCYTPCLVEQAQISTRHDAQSRATLSRNPQERPRSVSCRCAPHTILRKPIGFFPFPAFDDVLSLPSCDLTFRSQLDIHRRLRLGTGFFLRRFFFLLWLQCIEIKILIVFTQRSSTNNFTFIYLPLLAGSLFSRSGFAGRDKLKFEKRDIPGMNRWMMVDLARTGWNFSSKICLVICKSVSRVKCLQLDCLFRGNDRRRFDDRANFLPCM